jgi:predicted MFS family arabinose efflux permease
MIGLGIVLYISGITGSYARAGLLTAAFALSAAVAALLTSRLIDRRGQHRVLPTLIVIHGGALIGFVILTSTDQAFVWQFATIVLAGAAQPAIGSMVRARWVYVLDKPDQVRSAFALESIIDELIFTIGPLVTTAIALNIALQLPLVIAAFLAVTGTLALVAQRRTEPPPNPAHRSERRGSAIRSPGLASMVFIATGTGIVFGSYEVAVVAFTRNQGAPGASGIVLALWSIASLLGGLWFGSRNWIRPLPTLLLTFSVILALAVAPTPFITNVPILALSGAVSGLAIAPVLISLFSLTERLVPQQLLTEGLTWSNSGLAFGFSMGASVGGFIIDRYGTTWGFGLTIAGACLAALIARIARPRLLKSMRPFTVERDIAVPLNDDPVAGPGPSSV